MRWLARLRWAIVAAALGAPLVVASCVDWAGDCTHRLDCPLPDAGDDAPDGGG
jgi:hypothetical protein